MVSSIAKPRHLRVQPSTVPKAAGLRMPRVLPPHTSAKAGTDADQMNIHVNDQRLRVLPVRYEQ